MKDYEVLKVLIDSADGHLDVNKYTLSQQDENEFTMANDSSGIYGKAEDILNYLKQ